MKYSIYIFFLFLLSCSAKNWEFNDCTECKIDRVLKKYNSPNGDYSIDIHQDWMAYYQSNDSSNVVLDTKENQTDDICLISIVRYNSWVHSDPEKENQKNIQNLIKNNPSIEIIESGKTDLLGFEAYYSYTREKVENSPENIDLFFQVSNETDSNYYVLQTHTAANGNEKFNICLAIEMLKTFKLNKSDSKLE